MKTKLTVIFCMIILLCLMHESFGQHELKAERLRASARNSGPKFTYPE